MSTIWSHLSQEAVDPSYSDALRRVLGRLGEYTAQIVRPLNMRPTAARLLAVDGERVEVRIVAATSSVVLVVGPDADMAGELFWLRSMALHGLPAPRLIAHDLSGAQVPFSYLITAYVGGRPPADDAGADVLRAAARQCGRTLRRVHQHEAAGFGRPTPGGRWLSKSWGAALQGWLAAAQARERAVALLGEAGAAELWAATLEHPDLICEQPRLLHGALAPDRMIVTVGEGARMEALVRPGALLGGDPLLDVATALLPTQPAPFRQGFLEGYSSAGPLDVGQRLRLRRLSLLALLCAASTSQPAAELLGATAAAELRLLESQSP